MCATGVVSLGKPLGQVGKGLSCSLVWSETQVFAFEARAEKVEETSCSAYIWDLQVGVSFLARSPTSSRTRN